MPPLVAEWLNLVIRWTHAIAAIMWIGDSFLFMWMDRSLEPPRGERKGAVAGELWMVHSGGFYEVVKRRHLDRAEMPDTLHWFKWEAYTTWISGFLLLAVVYYLGGAAYLVDATSRLTGPWGIAISLGLLVLGWLVYDLMWSSPLGRRPRVAAAISCALIVGAAYGLTRLYSGRAAYVQLGAMMGTVMAANVWRRIIPAQTQMLAATRAGTPVDTSLGLAAKTRSIHNHYLTLPVVFTMLSNHFPATYGNRLNWLVLVLLMIFGAAIKHVMNLRSRVHPGIALAGVAGLVGAIALTLRGIGPTAAATSFRTAAPVPFTTARGIIERRCITCHAAKPSNPSFPQPPLGVTFDDPEHIRSLAPRIFVRAVETRTMPLGNLTGMTDGERDTLGAWIAQGARP
jgi:uncharacterized membrane protein